MKMPPMRETVIRPAPESAHMAEWLALVGRRVVLWFLLVATVTACGSAVQVPKGSLFESPDAPIPLRAGYWAQQPAFQNARFTGGGVEDVSLSATIESGLVALAQSTFRGSAQFESQATALASPIVDVVVVPTIEDLTMEKDPDGLGVKQIATVRMEWRVSDKTGRVLWSNVVWSPSGVMPAWFSGVASSSRSERCESTSRRQEPTCDRFHGGSALRSDSDCVAEGISRARAAVGIVAKDCCGRHCHGDSIGPSDKTLGTRGSSPS